jgi:hypothetical protein
MRARSAYGPSPPVAVHDLGSQAASGWTDAVGGAKPGTVVVVVVVVGGTDVVVVVPLGTVVVGGGVGGFTVKSVPVITVTSGADEAGAVVEVVWDPDELDASAMMTWPEIERATAWAAASSVGVSCEYSTTVSACSPTFSVVDTPVTSKPSAWRPVSAVWPVE